MLEERRVEGTEVCKEGVNSNCDFKVTSCWINK